MQEGYGEHVHSRDDGRRADQIEADKYSRRTKVTAGSRCMLRSIQSGIRNNKLASSDEVGSDPP